MKKETDYFSANNGYSSVNFLKISLHSLGFLRQFLSLRTDKGRTVLLSDTIFQDRKSTRLNSSH